MIDTYHDAIVLEQARRVGLGELVAGDCDDMNCTCNNEAAYMQTCACLAPPNIDDWSCSLCSLPYKRLQ